MRTLPPWLLLCLLCSPAITAASVTGPASPADSPVAATPRPAIATATATEAGPAAAAGAPATEAPRPAEPPYAARLRTDGRKVLQDPDFRQSETSRQPVLRDWLRKWLQRKEPKPVTPPPFNLALLVEVFKFLAVVLLALGLGWLLWRGWQWLAPQVAAPRPAPGLAPREAESLALPAKPLPDTISTAALAAWRAGDATQALSLLYRGAVRDLATRHRITLPASATEGECLRQARQSDATVVGAGFAPIVKAWMALAYARRLPADFEALLALYRRHFEAPPGEAP